MKPRVLKTYKILAVALTATAGCATTSGASPEPARTESAPVVVVPASDPVQAPQEVAPAPQPTSIAPVATVSAPAAKAEAPAPAQVNAAPERHMSNDPKLLALGSEIQYTQRDKVVANLARFKPLCDKDGYPLVGNMARKGPPIGFQPSAFCEGLRTGSIK
jgi:hypothetical protein